MELEELNTLWQKIDRKLDNLGKINKKMIFESVTKDRQKKLNRERYQYLFGLIIGPLGVTFFSFPWSGYFDWKILLGILFEGIYVTYSIFMSIRIIRALRSIDLNNDSILESVKKISYFKRISNAGLKFSYILSPLALSGALLVSWDHFVFDYKTIAFLLVVSFVSSFLLYINYRIKQRRYDNLESEILELNEYL